MTVTIELEWWERPFLGWRPRIEVPVAAVDAVERVGWPVTAGGRSALLISGYLKVGRWGIGTGRRQLVSARRGVPTLRVLIDRSAAGGLGWDELLIGTPDADRLAAELARVADRV
jgi:hypothetical protein